MKVSELFEAEKKVDKLSTWKKELKAEYPDVMFNKTGSSIIAIDAGTEDEVGTWNDGVGTIYLKEVLLSLNDVLLEEGNVEKALKNKAEKTGIKYGILKQVFNRGAAAWRQHHRPGVGQVQWAMGRVNSFITGKGQAREADEDLWKKRKG